MSGASSFRRSAVGWLAIVSVLAFGCGGGGSSGPTLNAVAGTATTVVVVGDDPSISASFVASDGSIQWQAADPGVYFSLLLGGRTDLFTASIDGDVPALMRVAAPQGKQVHFSSFADWGYDVFGYFLVARADRLASNPAEAKAFAAATAKAVAYSMNNPEETAQIMVKHNPTLDQATTLAQWRQSIKAINTDYVKKNGYGVATSDRIQRTIDLVKQAMKLETAPTVADVYAVGVAN